MNEFLWTAIKIYLSAGAFALIISYILRKRQRRRDAIVFARHIEKSWSKIEPALRDLEKATNKLPITTVYGEKTEYVSTKD